MNLTLFRGGLFVGAAFAGGVFVISAAPQIDRPWKTFYATPTRLRFYAGPTQLRFSSPPGVEMIGTYLRNLADSRVVDVSLAREPDLIASPAVSVTATSPDTTLAISTPGLTATNVASFRVSGGHLGTPDDPTTYITVKMTNALGRVVAKTLLVQTGLY